jgi:phosphotransferase system, enzyme I, PtsP
VAVRAAFLEDETAQARALGIPAVGEVDNATALVEAGDAIIVDGSGGEVQIRPPADVEFAYAEKARLRARRQEQYRGLRDLPAITRDGVKITLQMNAGLLLDLPHLVETGAEGVGLFRTELQFMIAERLPSPSDQQALYRAVFTAAGDFPIIFRTLDVGGDKILPYMRSVEERNPALGWRALRIALDRPGLLRAQMRGMLKAAAGRDLNVMFPMVATVDEFLRAKAIVEREQAHLRRHGHEMPARLSLGVMIEIPSLLFQLDELAAVADFVSVGSNDLMQYLFAADRQNRLVANRFDPLAVGNLRALKLIAERAAAQGCPAGVCGEIGGKPLEAMALIGLGYRRLSMSAASIGPVKAMILDLDANGVAAFLDRELAASGMSESLRPALTRFAEQHGIAA